MISDRRFAERTLTEASECFSKLNSLLLAAQEELPAGEFERLRLGIGKVLGYLYTDVEAPIFAEHPELEPPSLREE